MKPIEFIRRLWRNSMLRMIWSNPQTRIIIPGLLLAMGAFLALKPMTNGYVICDGGECIQRQTSAFGTIKETLTYSTTDIRGFRSELGYRPGEMRVLINVNGFEQPLTHYFTPSPLETGRIVSEGTRFVAEGATARFVASMSVGGFRSFIKPLALLMLLVGAGLAGHTLSRIPREEFTL